MTISNHFAKQNRNENCVTDLWKRKSKRREPLFREKCVFFSRLRLKTWLLSVFTVCLIRIKLRVISFASISRKKESPRNNQLFSGNNDFRFCLCYAESSRNWTPLKKSLLSEHPKCGGRCSIFIIDAGGGVLCCVLSPSSWYIRVATGSVLWTDTRHILNVLKGTVRRKPRWVKSGINR